MPAGIEHVIDRAGRFGQRLEDLVYNAAKAGKVVYRTKNDDLLVSYWSLVALKQRGFEADAQSLQQFIGRFFDNSDYAHSLGKN
jgi:hypothetical protein